MKEREVLRQIKQSRVIACSRSIVSSETIPLSPSVLIFFHSAKYSLTCSHAAYAAVAAIGQNDEGVVPKELRNRVLVVSQVVLVSVFQSFVAGFQLDEDSSGRPLIRTPLKSIRRR